MLQILSQDEHVYVLSKDEHVYVLSQDEHVSILSQDEHVYVLSKDEHVYVLSQDEHVSILSQDEHVYVLSKDEHVYVLSKDEHVYVLIKDEHVSILSQDEHVSILSQDEHVSVVWTPVTTTTTMKSVKGLPRETWDEIAAKRLLCLPIWLKTGNIARRRLLQLPVPQEMTHLAEGRESGNRRNTTKILKALLWQGKMPVSEDSETLFNALDNGHMAEVNEELDKYPESVNGRDEEHRLPSITLQIVPIRRHFLEFWIFLEVLIERGAQLTHVDKDKHSAVHWAVVCGQLETLIYLLKHGAPSNLPDAHGAYPLHYATVIEDVSVERASTMLHVLLKQGDNVNCVDNDNRTPLLWASSNGNVEGFKSLVQAGANKLAVDRDRLGVLHCAASHGHLEIIRTMLDMSHRNVVNTKDRNGDTPLFYASTFGHYECAKLLLENGADANHMDKRLRTAAHCAAAKGQLHILKLLKQYGASFELQNYRGDLAFHEAVQTGSKELVEWLLTIEPKFIKATNFYGRTPLHLAAASGNMELVVLLCTRGSEINPLMLYKNQMYTPLDLAKRREHELVVDYLSQRHDAFTSQQITEDKRNFSRSSIEEQLKMVAKLRKVRAQRQKAQGQLKIFRRGKSVQSVDSNGGPSDQRRSSSASEVRLHNLPSKSTSTTDLTKHASDSMLMNGIARKVSSSNVFGGMERQLVEDTIQKIVQKELRKTPLRTDATGSSGDSRKENVSPVDKQQVQKTNLTRNAREYISDEDGQASSSTQQSDLLLNGHNNNSVVVEAGGDKPRRKKRVQMEAQTEKSEAQVSNLSSASLARDLNNRAAKNLPMTELHIIEDGWEPPYGRMAFIESTTERRYVHEKAI
uniref:Uncharacterized protein n=1 Tax=Ditylenchus dipsaci TaxID=166011 RepID=A0A915EJ02_9BILA